MRAKQSKLLTTTHGKAPQGYSHVAMFLVKQLLPRQARALRLSCCQLQQKAVQLRIAGHQLAISVSGSDSGGRPLAIRDESFVALREVFFFIRGRVVIQCSAFASRSLVECANQ